MQRPVLHRHEGGDLALALGEQAHRHRLHATGREPAADLLPQERRELVAHQPVQHAPGLLGVDLVGVDLARVQEGGLDRALRDLVEHDPVRLGLADAELLGEVPADGLPFPVRVGRDVERVHLLGRLLQLVEHLLLGRQHLVLRLEALLLVHPELGFGQIADVAHRGLDDVLRVQILLDRLDLGGRLHHHQRSFHRRHPPVSYPRPIRTNRLPSICRTRPSSSSSSSAADTRPAASPLRSITWSISIGSSPEQGEHLASGRAAARPLRCVGVAVPLQRDRQVRDPERHTPSSARAGPRPRPPSPSPRAPRPGSAGWRRGSPAR